MLVEWRSVVDGYGVFDVKIRKTLLCRISPRPENRTKHRSNSDYTVPKK